MTPIDWTRLHDLTYGIAIGDAIGAPHANKPRGSYHSNGHAKDPQGRSGQWRSSTALTLATIDSLRRNHWQLDTEDLRDRYDAWRTHGVYAIDGQADEPARNPPAVLARILPLVALDTVSDRMAETCMAVLDPDRGSRDAAVTLANMAVTLAAGRTAKDAARRCGLDRVPNMEREVLPLASPMDLVDAAVWSLVTTMTFRQCVLTAVELGGPADLTGAVAGGLAAIRYGFGSIPIGWLRGLKGTDVIDAILDPHDPATGVDLRGE